jgi:hypothetical protein
VRKEARNLKPRNALLRGTSHQSDRRERQIIEGVFRVDGRQLGTFGKKF